MLLIVSALFHTFVPAILLANKYIYITQSVTELTLKLTFCELVLHQCKNLLQVMLKTLPNNYQYLFTALFNLPTVNHLQRAK